MDGHILQLSMSPVDPKERPVRRSQSRAPLSYFSLSTASDMEISESGHGAESTPGRVATQLGFLAPAPKPAGVSHRQGEEVRKNSLCCRRSVSPPAASRKRRSALFLQPVENALPMAFEISTMMIQECQVALRGTGARLQTSLVREYRQRGSLELSGPGRTCRRAISASEARVNR